MLTHMKYMSRIAGILLYVYYVRLLLTGKTARGYSYNNVTARITGDFRPLARRGFPMSRVRGSRTFLPAYTHAIINARVLRFARNFNDFLSMRSNFFLYPIVFFFGMCLI